MSDRRKHLEFLRKTAKDAIWSGRLRPRADALRRRPRPRPLLEGPRARGPLHLQPGDDAPRDGPAGLRSLASEGDRPAQPRKPERRARGAMPPPTRTRCAASTRKAAFYAQGALQKSRELGLDDWTGASLNLLANLELHESRFEQARGLFQEALDRFESDGRSESSRSRGRLRQPRVLPHRPRRGADRAAARRAVAVRCSRAWARARRWITPASTSASRRSSWNGSSRRRAGACAPSSSASEFGRNDVVKNAHYLLAETYSEMGRESAADEHYEALAHVLPGFPGAEELPAPDQPDGHDQPEGLMRRRLLPSLLLSRPRHDRAVRARRRRSRRSRC